MSSPTNAVPAPAAAGPGAVYAALSRSVEDGRIDLPAAARTEPALAGLVPALAALRVADVFVLSVTELAENAGAVWLTGSGRYGLPGADEANIVAIRARLTYTAPDGLDRFELSLALPAGWTFPATFPVLPRSEIAQPGGSVAYDESFLTDVQIEDAALTALAVAGAEAGVRLSGRLTPFGALEPYQDFFAPWPLPLDGPVVLPLTAADPPAFDLVAPSSRPPIVVPPAALDAFGVGLISQVGLDRDLTGTTSISVLEARAGLCLGGSDQAVGRVSVPLLAVTQVWAVDADFDAPSGVVPPGLAAVAQMLGMDPGFLSSVPGLNEVAGFRVTAMHIGLIPPGDPGGPALTDIAVTFASDRRWDPPVPYLGISGVGMRWVAIWGDGALPDSVTGTFFGTAEFGGTAVGHTVELGAFEYFPERRPVNVPAVKPGTGVGDAGLRAVTGDPQFSLTVSAAFPIWAISGRMVQGEIPLDQALLAFFGAAGPDSQLAITNLAFDADTTNQTFTARAAVTSDYVVPLLGDVSVALTSVELSVNVTASSVNGGITGTFSLPGAAPAGYPEPEFSLSADYSDSTPADPATESAPDWTFSGGLVPNSYVELIDLLAKFVGADLPDWVPTLTLTALDFTFSTGTGAYAVDGAAVGRWTPQPFGTPLALSAEAAADVSYAAGAETVDARLSGVFAVDRLAVSMATNLTTGVATYEFQVAFGDLWLSAVTGWRDGPDGTNPHQVITFQVGGVTLGDVLEYFVALAAPTLGFYLEPPWDLLLRVELARFAVTVDPTDGSMDLTYAANMTLPGMSIGTIGVRMRRQRGKPAVELILTGAFLGTAYPEAKPLAWDVLSQSPPAVPGNGNQLLDLRYLGVGQRIALDGPPPETVRDAIDRLSRAMRPAEPGTNPLRGLAEPGIRFAADAGWLIGLDASVADVLDLAVVFNDPRLYGLSVGLRGERAGSLAGLTFEILYKKISDDVGVFRIELKLPDAFRRIELGAVSVTLGIVVVEVYTNGNFLADLGFPHDRDFTRSFSVEVAPFLGRGGIYFGVLDGTTSTRVPAIANGTFAPVIALGVGLSVGVGKEMRSGPLSGGAYVELVAIFEGVFAWFNPTGSGTAPAQYYRVQATVALHGKVYGSVDFKVLKVSVVIEAWASATLTLESYKATQVRITASVRVSASVKVLFVRVSFSFSATLDLGFTLGSDQATPWILASGQAHTPGMALTRRPELSAQSQYAAHLAACEAADIQAARWDPSRPVFPGGEAAIVQLTLLPLFTADSIPVRWNPAAASAAPDAADAEYRVAFCLLAPDGPAAPTMLDALLRYALAAVAGAPYGPGVTVTAGQLQVLADELAAPQAADGPFGLAAMTEFFSVNLHLDIAGDPQTPTARAEEHQGTAVPLPPYLSWTSPQLGDRDLSTVNPVGPLYAWGAARYAAQFTPAPPPETPPPPDSPGEYEPFGGFLFGDWCLMVAKTGVQAAIDAMATWPVDVDGPTTPANVADRFPAGETAYAVRSGDTLDSVAAAVGATPMELEFLNPGLAATLAAAPAGAVLRILLGVSPDEVAVENAAVPLAGGVFPLGDVSYQVATGDTLDAIAARFSLDAVIDLFADPLHPLADDVVLLRARAEFPVEAVSQVWTGNLLSAAATYFAHYRAPIDVPYTDWYAQAVFNQNSDVIPEGGAAGTIPPDIELSVPDALYSDTYTSYVSVSGDTLGLIGTALSLAQNFALGTDGPVGWPAFRDATRLDADPAYVLIPAADVVVLPGESIAGLGLRTVVHAGDLPGLLGWIGGADVLTPLAVVPVPGARITALAGDTLAGLATRSGLALADLARRLAYVAIYAGTVDEPLRLTVRNLPVQGVDQLVDAVLVSAAADVNGNSSRQLLSGLRLPSPVYAPDGHATATGSPESLYVLTGQQADGPTPDPEQPDAIGLEATITVNADAPWITLASSEVAGAPAAGADAARPDVTVGPILRTGAADALVYSYTNADLAAEYPALELVLPDGAVPQPLPTGDTVPVTYDLDHRIALQSAVPLPLPPIGDVPLSGTATVWPFPTRLLARARTGGSGLYDVVRAAARAGQPADVVPGTTFGTLLTFRLRRTGDNAHVYELLGADTDNRELALALYRYLTAPDTVPGTKLLLTAAPAPDAPDTAGQAVLDAKSAATFLLRTNQSTQSVAPGALADTAARARAAADDPDYADLSDPAGFCLLLWEGSVVGGTGYYLGFETADGGDLPAGLFDPQGEAQLGLLAVVGGRQALAPEGRALLPIDTCALVGATLDPDVSALFVESSDGSETTVAPSMPPGTAGVRLLLPDPGEGQTPDELVRRLFSLATYAIPDDGRYSLERSGLPAGPQQDDGLGLPLWLRERRERWARAGRTLPAVGEAQQIWRYEQAFPISRYAAEQPAPEVPGLPDPAADPYRGVSGPAPPVVRFSVGFADVLGNLTAPPVDEAGAPGGGSGVTGDGNGLVPVPAGYTDAVLAVSSWPAVTLGYIVEAPDHTAGDLRLTVTISPQPAATAPAADPDQVREAAQRQAERYAEVYYQLLDGRLAPSVRTSLRQEPDGAPTPLPADPAPLLRYAAGAYAAARAAASVLPVLAGGTLADICDTYTVTLDQLAAANGARPARQILGDEPTVPAYAVFAAGDTADRIAATPRPDGWPRPVVGAAVLALDGNATVLPLRPAVLLNQPDTVRVVPDTQPTPSLADMSARANTTPGVLADDNAVVPGILAPGFVFTAGGLQVTVPDDRGFSFDDARLSFAAIGVIVTVATLATENGGLPGMFLPSARLVSRHYLVDAAQTGQTETLATTLSGYPAEALAEINGATPDVFDDGALVLLGVFAPEEPAPAPAERLDAYAARFACPPALLLAANAGVTLAGDAVIVPGAVALPDGEEAPRVPYTVAAGEYLDQIAGRFGTAALALAEANREMPDMVAPGLTVTVPVGDTTVSTGTVPGDSFGSVYGRLADQDPQVLFPALVAVLAPVPGTLADAALLLCPHARLTGAMATRGAAAAAAQSAGVPATLDTALAPADLADAYHLDPALIAQANLATAGLIVPGVELSDPLGSTTVLTGPQDTFNTLATRFAQNGVGVDTTALIAANFNRPFLRAGAAALLPPAPVRLTVLLGAEPGPFATPAFPLTTTLRLTRPAHLVDPAFRTRDGSGTAEQGEAVVPAPAAPQGVGDGASLTLGAFAAAFHAAFPALRLGTARVADQARPQDQTADLWVVDFRPDGIAVVDLVRPVPMPDGATAPRCFALRPLYNDLVTRTGVPIRALQTDGTLAPPDQAVPTDYQGVDIEVPARRLLADVDLFLSAGYAAALYANPDTRAALDTVLTAKRRLSGAVARGLAVILDLPDPGAASGLSAAISTLTQELAVSLSSAYATAAVVQYEALVDSPWTRGATDLPPARFYGTAAQLGTPEPAGRRVGTFATDQPYTLSAAKTALDRPATPVTFLMRVPDPGLHGAVPIDLGYDILDLEFDITPVPGVPGYEDSQWLAFYPPLAGDDRPSAIRADLGAAVIPVPLRAYPALPSLIGQAARPSATTPRPSLTEARLWTYSVTYAHEHAEQDEVLVTVRFNVRPEPALAKASSEDVATALIRYSGVADGLWTLLGRFTGDTTVKEPDAVNAAATFAELADQVTAQWERRWPAADAAAAAVGRGNRPASDADVDDGPAPRGYAFRISVQYGTDRNGNSLLERVILSTPDGQAAPADSWPGVLVRDSDGTDVRLTEEGGGVERTYTVPPPTQIPAGEPPTLTLDWARLPVAEFQNGRAELSVQRNRRLLGPFGPATVTDFVYQTPLVQAPGPVAPMLSWPEPLDISLQGPTLAAALAATFAQLSAPLPGLPATIGARYGYPMVTSADAVGDLMAYVPVTLAPDSELTAQAAARLAAQVDHWADTNEPAPVPGRTWAFALAIHSQLNPADRQPLLSLGQLVYRIRE